MFCPKCGAAVEADAAYCQKCGYHFESNAGSTAPPTEAPKTEEKKNAQTFTDVKPKQVISELKGGSLFNRVFAILFSPSKEWDKIAQEKPRISFIIFGYLLILGVVAFLAIFIGSLINVFRDPWVSVDMLFSMYFMRVTVFSVIKMFALIGSPIIAALIINSLCPSFKTEKNFGKILQITAFSFTPVFVAWTMYIIPFPFIYYLVQLLSLYGIIILLLGFKKVLVIPNNNQVGFFFTMIGILYGVYYMIYWTIQFIQAPIFHMGYNYYSY